jgi:hypothetical protein
MANNLGFSGLNNNLNSQDPTREIFQNLDILNNRFISGRVVDIIISNTHPLFNEEGGWSGLGTIFFEPTDNLTPNKPNAQTTAQPLIPYLKNYPLVNEIVMIFSLPSKLVDLTAENALTNQYYYINPISIWNNNHHNAYPNTYQASIDSPPEKSYQEIEGGSPRVNKPNQTEISFNSPLIGGTFEERSNIHPLMPFAGDIISEGRWGNSIRLGSTVTGSNNTKDYLSTWSRVGENGDPITIIKNGQPSNASEAGWLPIVENIEKDLSSIYATSYQQIPLKAASENFSALSPEPLLPREYSNPQIILNSGRLVFNASSDSIIITSQDIIALSSNNQVGITSKNVNIAGDSIKIGGSTADQQALLGNAFIEQFRSLVDQLQILSFALSELEGYDSEATNIESSGVALAGENLDTICQNILNLLPNDNKITSPLLSNTIRLK